MVFFSPQIMGKIPKFAFSLLWFLHVIMGINCLWCLLLNLEIKFLFMILWFILKSQFGRFDLIRAGKGVSLFSIFYLYRYILRKKYEHLKFISLFLRNFFYRWSLEIYLTFLKKKNYRCAYFFLPPQLFWVELNSLKRR